MDDNKNRVPRWEELPRETREMTSFLHLVISETFEEINKEFSPTYIRCFGKKCTGIIETAINIEEEEIYWRCVECKKSGVISGIFGE